MQMLVEYLAGRSEKLPESLRLVMMSGDWIPIDLPYRIKGMGAMVKVVSLGGATEASIWSILYPIEKVEPQWTSIPYGRPMVNQSFHVLNHALAPCPVWVPGQLYIGGVGLAKGYLRDAGKTRASFITHSRTGERLYRTGDLGRYLLDGNIEFLGREDFQVKIRGHRIELGEIETTLLQHPGVCQAVVIASGETRENTRLVAYVVPNQDVVKADLGKKEGLDSAQSKGSGRAAIAADARPNRTLADSLREFLRRKLPEYMVPSNVLLLEMLPLSANGKVDRKALPKPENVKLKTTATHVEPRTEWERVLADIWREVLGIEKIGVNDNIFELGGNSLKAIQIIVRAEGMGMKLSGRQIFEHQTIAALAALYHARSDEHSTPIIPIPRLARQVGR